MSGPAVIPSGLPDENYLIQRLGLTDVPLQTQMLPYLKALVPILYAELGKMIDAAIPSRTVYSEQIYVSGKLSYALTRFWPIATLQQVLLGGTIPVRPGSLLDLARGRCGCAISNNKSRIELGAAAMGSAPFYLFVDYACGYDQLPNDLLEVFTQLAWLMWKEKGRVGESSMKVDIGMAVFTRKLPDWCRRTVNSYKRMEIYS